MSACYPGSTYLPHLDFPNTIQFVTFRLFDSMPVSRRHEWEQFFSLEPESSQKAIQAYLDAGLGDCSLCQPAVAAIVEEELLRGENERYRLFEWVVMPNHVHVLFQPTQGTLAQILQSWKGASARRVNLLLGRSGPFWFRDYFDRYIRGMAHFEAAVRYIHMNPVKAGLALSPEAYPWSSARLGRVHFGG